MLCDVRAAINQKAADREMELFGILGMSLGGMGFILAPSARTKISKLENQLTSLGVLEQESKSE